MYSTNEPTLNRDRVTDKENGLWVDEVEGLGKGQCGRLALAEVCFCIHNG